MLKILELVCSSEPVMMQEENVRSIGGDDWRQALKNLYMFDEKKICFARGFMQSLYMRVILLEMVSIEHGSAMDITIRVELHLGHLPSCPV